MEQSAVDFLLYYLPNSIKGQFKEQIEQAKAKEKEEKVKFALKVYLEKRQTHGGDIMQIAEKLVNL